MTVTAPESIARQHIIDLLTAEFTPEGFSARSDKLHESLGWKGTRIGVSPVRTRPSTRNSQLLESQILVQFYNKWNKEINPEQSVDPTVIETYAERFRRALRTGDPNTATSWYFALTEMSYPDDPTGNKTRFEATVVAYGSNPALTESIG